MLFGFLLKAQPRKVLLEQLGRFLPTGVDDSLPSSLLIVSTMDPQGALVASLLNASSALRPAICTAGHADVRATVNCLVNRIQRYIILFGFLLKAQPRKVLLEQLGRFLPTGVDDSLPSSLLIVSTMDPQGALVASLLNASSALRPAICTAGHADVRATVNCLVNRIQRYCNSNAKTPNPVKVVLVGSDCHVNAAVKPFVEQLSSRPPDWQSYIRFLIVPLGVSNISRYIASIDNGYGNLFGIDGGWRELLEKEELIRKADGHEILSRVSQYIESSSGCLQLPIAEAMITYKEKSSDEGSSQVFIPFISVSVSNISRYIASIDNGYGNLFGIDGGWRELLEKEELIRKADGHEILSRVSQYIESSSGCLQLPIAEAMITYKEKSSDEGSSQVFIPFISEVRIAFSEPLFSASVDLDESCVGLSQGNSPGGVNAPGVSISGATGGNLSAGAIAMPSAASSPAGAISGSPPSSSQFGSSLLEARARLVGNTTPPSSPNIGMNHPPSYSQEPLDLQIDYWLSPGTLRLGIGAGERGADRGLDSGRGEERGGVRSLGGSRGDGAVSTADAEKSAKGGGKCSLRASFRSLIIQRQPALGETSGSHHFTMTYSLKEKKQKNVIQRLGKKKSEKESEGKSITVEGINRLVCMARAQNSPLRVTIDGMEWSGVKFFQLSSQWQTHVKHFPVATIAPLSHVLGDR
ncbi:unnamed protein product [Notodromas monacha]|uniref:Phosphofurin acidic cluster sorting protein 1/2 C-terminal domain-containing protein n=1 Tax=Notodromas monacha TaxID=399045 RepID=A0A7R9BF45_9CRUS|nr:unnamed protein product [Notodromas monacha]CAG0912965.1 unnamed protein product [Notodromas monacha]